MKKYTFTSLLLLCLLTVTGGTFAAWTFYTGKVEAAEAVKINTNMEITTKETAWGKINITTKDLAIVVEPKEDQFDYTAKLSFTGSIVASFTPTAKDADLSQFKGWKAVATITQNAQYENSNIFKTTIENNMTQEGHEEFTITSVPGLSLNKDFKLNSKTKANEFFDKLKTVTINITISEKE